MFVMDCQMPGLDGYETTRLLRARGFELPIIALTANAFQADKDRCFEAGMNDYLAKPAFSDQLLPILDRYLEETRHALDEGIVARLQAVDAKGDKSLLKTLHRLYRERTPILLGDLERSMEQGDFESIRRAAHALRSSCSNIGALQASNLLFDIEEKAAERITFKQEDVREQIRLLKREVARAEAVLARYASVSYSERRT